MTIDTLKEKLDGIYGWSVKGDKVEPPKHTFPKAVKDRADYFAEMFQDGMTFLGCLDCIFSDKKPDDYEVFGKNAGETCKVIFDSGCFRLKTSRGRGRGFWFEDDSTVTIIGNVWENPELFGGSRMMKKYKVSIIFDEDYWPWAYIVEAENFQEALKEASKRNRASDEDITRVEIVEV